MIEDDGTETYYASIWFNENKEVEIINRLQYIGEPDHIGATPETSYEGWCEVSGQSSLTIKSNDFTSEWLRENITEELVSQSLNDDEQVYDFNYADFEGVEE